MKFSQLNTLSRFQLVPRFVRRAALLLVVICPVLASAADQRGGNPNPGVVPLNGRYAGLSYSDWSIRWWQWAARTLTINSPSLDTTGAHVAEGQSGPLWFLTWSFFGQPVVRTATIPAGTALMFPATNHDPFLELPPGSSVEALRAAAVTVFDNIVETGAELDGVPIRDITSYRVVSDPYYFSFPEGNLFGLPTFPLGPTVNAGYYIILLPLPAGPHTLHVHFRYNGANGAILSNEVTYNLTVTDSAKTEL